MAGDSPERTREAVFEANNDLEERVLRRVELCAHKMQADPEWCRLATDHFRLAFSALRHSLYPPPRRSLPEDSRGKK